MELYDWQLLSRNQPQRPIWPAEILFCTLRGQNIAHIFKEDGFKEDGLPTSVPFFGTGWGFDFVFWTGDGTYFVRPPSVFNLSLAAACAAASRAVNTRNGEHET